MTGGSPFPVAIAAVAGGDELPYAATGDAQGPAAVFLHGFGDTWRSFEQVLTHLPGSIRALAVTQRGHGDASKPATGYRVEDFARDLEGFLDAVEVEHSFLVTSSSAAYTVRRFAAARSERVLGLVLIGAPWQLRTSPESEAVIAAISGIEDPVDPSFVVRFVEETAGQNVPRAFLDLMIAEGRQVPAHVWKAVLAGLLEEEPVPVTHATTHRTLLVWGDADRFVSRRDQESLLASLPRSRLAVYEGVGHMVHWEQPRRVAADIAVFVTQPER